MCFGDFYNFWILISGCWILDFGFWDFDFLDLYQFSTGKLLTLKISHSDESTDEILCKHTYNDAQIEWFKAGSALNLISAQ